MGLCCCRPQAFKYVDSKHGGVPTEWQTAMVRGPGCPPHPAPSYARAPPRAHMHAC
jgi:hypothetical protein